MSAAERGRAFVKLDRYGLADLGRELNLSFAARGVLLGLVTLADFRSWTWRGTIGELSENVGTTRTTVRKGLDELAAAGAIAYIAPPHSGRSMTVEVAVFGRLVVGAVRPEGGTTLPTSPQSSGSNFVDTSSTLRRHFAENSANDQGKRPPPKGSRDEGLTRVTRAELFSPRSSPPNSSLRCGFSGCTELVDEHSFTDHEPVADAAPPDLDDDAPPHDDSDFARFAAFDDDQDGPGDDELATLAERVPPDAAPPLTDAPPGLGMSEDATIALILRKFPGSEVLDDAAPPRKGRSR